MYMIIDFILLALFVLTIIYQHHQTFVYAATTCGIIAIIAIMPKIIQSFVGGKRGLSFEIRTNEINYYLEKITYNHWFGLGFPDSKRYDQLIHGPSSTHLATVNANYYLEDIGFLGVISVFGFLGIVGLVWFLIKLLSAFIRSQYKRELLLIIVYLATTLGTLSLLDPQRIFYLFTLIYIIEILAKSKIGNNLEEVL